MPYLISLIPLVLYIIAMLAMDAYSLTRRWVFFQSVLSGLAVAAVCFFISVPVRKFIGCGNLLVEHFFPILEEVLKALPLLFLLQKRKIASFLDAFIYGAAVGCAFAFVENIAYILCFDFDYPLLVLRAFSTSLMHAGCTAIFSLIMYETLNLRIHYSNWRWLSVFLCVVPISIHLAYNLSSLLPNLKFVFQIIIFSFLFFLSWKLTDTKIRKWMFEKGDSQMIVLISIENDSFYSTHLGKYFFSLTREYPPRLREEMMNYIHLCLQLSTKAKGRAMAKSAGFDCKLSAEETSEIKEQLAELKRMERKFNFAMMNIIRPIARLSRTDRWSLQQN